MPDLTIDQTVQLVALVLFAGLAVFMLVGWREILGARRLTYYLLRRKRVNRGWQMVAMGFVLGVAGLAVQFFGRQAAYVIVPPTPSITPSPTITPTPTITGTPTITLTPTITGTPTITPTPTVTGTLTLPEGITVLFRETVTPRPDAVFSPIQVARRLDASNRAIDPSDTFENPIGRLYGAFTYDNLQDGVRWTAIWLHEGEIVCLETKPWDGGTGGFGFTECEPEVWLPGEYEIQMFVGEEWKVSTRFTVVGDPVMATPSPAVTPTP